MIKSLAKKLKRLGDQLAQANDHLNSSYKKNDDLKDQVRNLQTKYNVKELEIQELEIRYKSLQEQK